MKALVFIAALSTFMAVAPVVHAGSPDFAKDSRDIEIEVLQERAQTASRGPVFVTPTNPALDPAYVSRDVELMALQDRRAASVTGSVTATNDMGLVRKAPTGVWDPALTGRDREILALQKRAFGS